MHIAMPEGVVLPFAGPVGADPSAALAPAPALRTGRAKLRIGRPAAEVRLPALGASTLALPTARVAVPVRRSRASARLQAT